MIDIKIPTLNDYLEYVDEHMTNEDNMQDKMQEWTLQEFQIYFGHDTTKEQDNEWRIWKRISKITKQILQH